MNFQFSIFKRIFLVLILSSLLLAVPGAGESIEIENPLEAETFQELVDAIINFIYVVALWVAPLMIVIGAYFFLFSGGRPEYVSRGKKIIVWTLIGFSVILLSKGLITFLREEILGVGP